MAPVADIGQLRTSSRSPFGKKDNSGMDNSENVVLITGVSSGIGQATARQLASAGYRVFGTSRHPEHCAPIDDVTILALDVCDPASVKVCLADVLAAAGRVDVLINNAGYGVFGAIEETSESEVRTQFETNYLGVVRLTTAVLPVMRAQRSGRIINLSSIAGILATPFMGHYSASKFAVEGFTEALRHEIAALGVHVSLIEPAIVSSPLWTRGLAHTARAIDVYDRPRSGVESAICKRVSARSLAPERVAQKIATVLKARRPGLRYTVGAQASLANHLKSILPLRVVEAVWRHQMARAKPSGSFLSISVT